MANEIPIRLEQDKTMYPFAGKTEFQPIKYGHSIFREGYNPARLASELKFNGVHGGLYACVPSRPIEINGNYPMGPVSTDISFDGLNEPEVRRTPLQLLLFWSVKSVDELAMMLRYRPRLALGIHEYTVRYAQEAMSPGDLFKIAIGRFVVSIPLHLENPDGRLTYKGNESMSGMAVPTIIPDDLVKLATVGLTMEDSVLATASSVSVHPQRSR